jgi:hypothetical protein
VLFAGFCVLAASVALVQAAADPVFLVKFGDTIDGKTLDIVAGTDVASHVSLNNRGDVAFLGYWDADNDGFPERRGIFTPNRLIVETGMTVGGHVLVTMGRPSINESGTVAFVATWDDDGDGFGDGQGIFTQHQLVAAEGQTIAGVRVDRLSGFDFPIVNDAGEVAFYAELNESPNPFCTPGSFCPAALMTQDRVLVRETASIGGYDVRVLAADAFGSPVYDFNAAGESAVIALTDPGGEDALLVGSQWIHRTGQTIGGRTLMWLGAPSINDLGQIAVGAGFGDPVAGIIDHGAVLDRNGIVVEDGDLIDGFALDKVGSVAALNSLGEIVFGARYWEGAVLRWGWFTQHRFLTPMDVTIDGIEVFLLGLPKINDAGDVVFFAAWDANGDGDPRLEGSGIVLIANDRDTTPPVISTPGNIALTATSASGTVATFTVTATDDVDGLITPSVVPPSGSLFPVGTTTVTATATDAAGNTATASFTVSVTYSWSGVLQPINADRDSVFKGGSTIPVKFMVTGASAGITDAVAHLGYIRVGSTGGTVNGAVSTSAATSGSQFRYDPSSGQYVFNMSTRGLAAGQYRLDIDLHVGVERSALIGFGLR